MTKATIEVERLAEYLCREFDDHADPEWAANQGWPGPMKPPCRAMLETVGGAVSASLADDPLRSLLVR